MQKLIWGQEGVARLLLFGFCLEVLSYDDLMDVLQCSLHCLLCSAFSTDPRLLGFFNHDMKSTALSIKQSNGMALCFLWLPVSKPSQDKLLH